MGEATIRDVARRAEVSVASVSRALNGHESVRPETRDRVVAAAVALGYVPHAGARSLSMSRALAIGVVLPDLHGEFFSECVRGMDREANRRGYLLLLSHLDNDEAKAAAALRDMHGRVDGLLVMAPHISAAALSLALPDTLPYVLINAPAEFDTRPSLRIDNVAGAEAVVRHLIDNGYRHIIHVSGAEGNIDAQERVQGYLAAMRSYAPDVEPRVIEGDFNEDSGLAAARRVLAGGEPCDAIFAANDMMAIGCLHALRNAGKSVPGDIAVAGFDDVPLAFYLALTTARVDIADMGARAVARLVDRLEGKETPDGGELHRPVLVARESTAHRAH